MLLQCQGRRELEHRVAVVIGVARRVHRAVARGDPDVARGIHHRCGAAHPHCTLVLTGGRVHGEDLRRPSGFGHGDHATPVGGAVAVVAAKPEHDMPGIERQPGALQQGLRRGTRRINVLSELCLARAGVETDQHVRRSTIDQLVRHREQFGSGLIDHRGPCDADRRRDVPARKVTTRHGGADVGRPEDGTRARRQCVHRVVLSGDKDAIAEHQGFRVERSVERGRRPRPRRQVDTGNLRRHAGPGRAAVVDGPRLAGRG